MSYQWFHLEQDLLLLYLITMINGNVVYLGTVSVFENDNKHSSVFYVNKMDI